MTMAEALQVSQVYSHLDEEGVWRHFHIGLIEEHLKDGTLKPPLIDAALEVEVVEALRAHSGLERRGFELAVQRLDEPILIALFDSGDVIVIDGNHRMVARYDLGYETVRAFILPPEVWPAYLIQGIPDDLAKKAVGL